MLKTSIEGFYAEVQFQQNTLATQFREGADKRTLRTLVHALEGKNAAFVFSQPVLCNVPEQYKKLVTEFSETSRVAAQNNLIEHDKQWTRVLLTANSESRVLYAIHGTESENQFWRLSNYAEQLAKIVKQSWILLKRHDEKVFWLSLPPCFTTYSSPLHILPDDGYSFCCADIEHLFLDLCTRNSKSFSLSLFAEYKSFIADHKSIQEKPVWLGRLI